MLFHASWKKESLQLLKQGWEVLFTAHSETAMRSDQDPCLHHHEVTSVEWQSSPTRGPRHKAGDLGQVGTPGIILPHEVKLKTMYF